MENNYQQQENTNRKDSNKIYFLIIVIVALLGTNAYLYFKDRKSNERIVTLTDDRTRMETEIDKIEAELDKANNTNIVLSKQMEEEQELARQKINELREQLKKGQLTQGQLEKAQRDIKQLRYFVSKYTADIEDLKRKNATLIQERDSLQTTVSNVSAQATELAKQNEELNTKVKAAAALKAANISVIPLRIRNNGKETDVSRANSAEKLRVSFSVADNSVASKGMHDIYLRIIDPSGNLIITGNTGMFTTDNEELQYTYRTAIEFNNDGKSYTIDWTNPEKFQKGTYNVVLYADGYTMGRSSVTLR